MITFECSNLSFTLTTSNYTLVMLLFPTIDFNTNCEYNVLDHQLGKYMRMVLDKNKRM